MSTTLLSDKTGKGLVLVEAREGYSLVPMDTPLRRLHYFDGKFLRAHDLELEQQSLRSLVHLSNQAGGPGVVHGFDCTLQQADDGLQVGPGLAIDHDGRTLYLPHTISIGIDRLITESGATRSLLRPNRIARFEALSKSQPQALRAFVKAQYPGDLEKLAAGRFQEISDPAVIDAISQEQFRLPQFGDCELLAETEPKEVFLGSNLYLITIGHVEAYCGEEDVYGKLCEKACVTKTERPFILEGIVLRADPLKLVTGLKSSRAVPLTRDHLRSLVASAFFADERNAIAPLISGAGLSSGAWCLGASLTAGRTDVPIALLAREGPTTQFLDVWTVRRERMEAPPRQYWAWRMAMRPWSVFLAQVLQFQCQVHDLFRDGVTIPKELDPCRDEREVISEASKTLEELTKYYTEASAKLTTLVNRAALEAKAAPKFEGGLSALKSLQGRLQAMKKLTFLERLLIRKGIVELPSAGFLPVVPGSSSTVNAQVRRLLGEGVDLRFCIVSPDYIPHALEEAQHMERISLIEGLDNPKAKPEVDILVPNGRVQKQQGVTPGRPYEMSLAVAKEGLAALTRLSLVTPERQIAEVNVPLDNAVEFAQKLAPLKADLSFYGAARSEELPTGGGVLYYAGLSGAGVRDTLVSGEPNITTPAGASSVNPLLDRLKYQSTVIGALISSAPAAVWVSLSIDRDPFEVRQRDRASLKAEFILSRSTGLRSGLLAINLPASQAAGVLLQVRFSGQLQVVKPASDIALGRTVQAHIDGWATVKIQGRPENQDIEQTNDVRISEEVILVSGHDSAQPPTLKIQIPAVKLLSGIVGRCQFGAVRQWKRPGELTTQAFLESAQFGRFGFEFLSTREGVRPVNPANVSSPLEDFAEGPNRLDLFEALQKESQAALNPGHKAHESSTVALKQIAKAMNDQRFEELATGQLFPPPRPVSEDLLVQATDYWVLFHRRRSQQCREDVVPQVTVQPRSYRLYHIGPLEDADAKTLKGLLDSGGSIASYKPKPVAQVDYGAGVQTVQSDQEDLRIDWRAAVKGDVEIVLGVIASQGAAIDEGAVLADARLDSLVEVLRPVAEVAAEPVFVTLPAIPEGLVAGEKDGVILLVTSAVETICHSVYRLAITPTGNNLGAFTRAAKKGLRELLNADKMQEVHEQVKFRTGTSTFYQDITEELKKTWVGLKDGQIKSVRVIYMESAGSQNLLKDQALQIAQAIRPKDDGYDVGLTTSKKLDPCPVATVLITDPEKKVVCNEVFVLDREVNEDNYKQIVSKVQKGDLSPKEATLKRDILPDLIANSRNLGRVWFDEDSNEIVPEIERDTLSVLQQISKAIGKSFDLKCIAVSPSGTAPDFHERHIVQAKTISEKASGPSKVAADFVFPFEQFPSQCAAITLLVPVIKANMGFVAAPGSMVSPAAPAFSFHVASSGELVPNEEMTRKITEWSGENVTFDRIELAAEEEPKPDDPRLAALAKVLRDNGLLSERREVGVRKLTREETENYKTGEVFILKKAGL